MTILSAEWIDAEKTGIRCIVEGRPLAQVLAVSVPGDASTVADQWRGLLPEVTTPPEPVPAIISDRQFFQALAMAGVITQDEALEAAGPGVIPAALDALLSGFPADEAFYGRMLLRGATMFDRYHPMTLALATGMNWSQQQVDDLWRTAAAL